MFWYEHVSWTMKEALKDPKLKWTTPDDEDGMWPHFDPVGDGKEFYPLTWALPFDENAAYKKARELTAGRQHTSPKETCEVCAECERIAQTILSKSSSVE